MASYRNYADYRISPAFKASRIVAMKRAQGLCEECKSAAPTEVHHKHYPECEWGLWGLFDTPGNLEAVCHECHCRIHQKDD